MTIDGTHTPGTDVCGADASGIVVKQVTSEEYCELCVSRRTLHRSEIHGLRGLFEPATRTHFVEQPRLRRTARMPV